ncbi:hypothetical protein LTR84_011614 [Exophiala bonariae]|uniref:F-box domain-containing protein n=1 Tax=Exophiala bonariae TaxID=1690606 RepID=A0AAV9NGY6_9EURO|nr:hypothetical protein LTR84_011614 [Exophiala bonariae]
MSEAVVEKLPTEILEAIFLQCLNGNLLLASPRIAQRLSGNQPLYRTAFSVAFYGHQLGDVLSQLGLSFMIPRLPDRITAWMARSMTKAVLRSLWCTDRWAVNLSQSLLNAAMYRLSQRTDLNTYVREVVRKYQSDSSTAVTSAGHDSSNLWRQTVASLDCHHPLHLEFTTTEGATGIFFADDTDDENTITLFEFTMTFCGAGSERHEQLRPGGRYTSGRGLNPVGEPFSVYVTSMIMNTMDVDATRRDEFWTGLDRFYAEPLSDIYGGECDRLHWRFGFRQQVAISYLLSPEKFPFRISSEIYRRAIDHDVGLLLNTWAHSLSTYVPRYVHFLFEIDPMSMPRQDPIILRWAHDACYRIRLFGQVYQQERLERLDDGEDEPWPGRTAQRRQQVLAKYTFDVEVRMVRYIKTGEPPYPPNDPAPHLQNAITQLGDILGPSLDIAAEDEEEIAVNPLEDPNPPELGFLQHDDYRTKPRRPEDDQEDKEKEDEGLDASPLLSLESFENGTFTMGIIKDPVESVLPSLDQIALELRQRGKIYWLSPDDCKIPSQFVKDYKWYKEPLLTTVDDDEWRIVQ